jgi:hypothetical protein
VESSRPCGFGLTLEHAPPAPDETQGGLQPRPASASWQICSGWPWPHRPHRPRFPHRRSLPSTTSYPTRTRSRRPTTRPSLRCASLVRVRGRAHFSPYTSPNPSPNPNPSPSPSPKPSPKPSPSPNPNLTRWASRHAWRSSTPAPSVALPSPSRSSACWCGPVPSPTARSDDLSWTTCTHESLHYYGRRRPPPPVSLSGPWQAGLFSTSSASGCLVRTLGCCPLYSVPSSSPHR